MTREELERIGEVLLEEGVLTQEEVARAIAEGGARGSPVALLLESLKHPRRADLASFLAAAGRIPRIEDLRTFDLTSDLAPLVPESAARRHELVPVAKLPGLTCVAKGNYFNRSAIQELRQTLPGKIKIFQADEGQVKAAIERVYKRAPGDLPAPKIKQSDSAIIRTAAPAAAREAVPLISMAPDPLPPVRSGPAIAASKVAAADYQEQERQLSVRLISAWDDLFINGAPVPPVRVS